MTSIPPPDSMLYQTFAEADRLRQLALADGVSKDEANAIVAKALHAAWPRGRVEPWKYLCEICSDTGWHPLTCPAYPCDRTRVHSPHDYVRHCGCAKGRRMTPQPRTEEDAVAIAAKARKTLTRFGR